MPAAAVIRREQALSGITGRKERVGGTLSLRVNLIGSTDDAILETAFLRTGEESGIPGVAVKCVDIGRNTSGEGGFLADS